MQKNTSNEEVKIEIKISTIYISICGCCLVTQFCLTPLWPYGL